ncbi:PDZ domain-containing protein [Alistipes sp. OttesenSCG-928-B03]|nr:PDZ domain-containing protein [Alistipes sp. OttesenSCG-928-B03]
MKKTFILTLLLLLCGQALHAQDEARLLRFPTTNGSEIVFSYAGDLYRVPATGGEAVRLTSHVGYEMFPRFSPDGKTIAFTGQYDGNTEIYTIPATGGEPLRVTYTATNSRDDLGDRMGPNNIAMGWTPDGERIVYRNRRGDGFTGQLYTVSRHGGLSEQIALPEGGFCSYSPDGKRLAYNRVMREFRTWKYYEGGMADDVWVYDPKAGTVENITENKAQDVFPMWVGDDIFFCSDRDRTMNIFRYDTRTKQTAKVTDFTEYDVKFPSAGGGMIVFENGGYIWKMDAATQKAEKVTIRLSSDNIYARSEIKNGAGYVTSASVSPDGERVAVTTRGEVFDVPATKGVTRNITRTPGAHERSAQWSPDGRHIAYISDRTGEDEIWLQPADGGETVQATRNTDVYIRSFGWSPDSKRMWFVDRKNRLNLVDVAARSVSMLFQDPAGEPQSVSFSHDSRWLTYTRKADNKFNIVYIYNIAEGKEYAVSDRWYSSGSPCFSSDGKYLFFNSSRDFNPTYSSTEWNHVYNNMGGLYMALLAADTPSPFLEKDAGRTAEVKTEAQGDAKKAAKDESGAVRFDADGIGDRILRVPVGSGYFRPVYATGTKVYYSGGHGTRVYDLSAQKGDDVAQGTMRVGPGSKKALFTSGGKYYVTDIPSGKASLSDEVKLGDMKIEVDYPAEWTQIYNEAWRMFRDGFYVANMHGVDWAAMREKYAVMLPYVKTRLDLNYLIGELIGELNVGHAYVNPGEMERAPRVKMGLLGAKVSRDRSGFYRIDRILPCPSWNKELRSPLTEPGLGVKEGEYIVAIDGVATNSVNDMYRLLIGKAGVLTELQINSRPQLAGARRVVISPIASEAQLYHWNWVQENIRKVDKATGGRVGYIYIPDMGPEGLNEFARHFYPQLDKEALIIDDRANGGGNVSPMILERLQREPYRLTMSRQTNQLTTIPNGTLVGPMVCLINKYSASDGDQFPWGFRALGLGKLIGTRTWGGIVGIGGTLPFIDGTDLRVPVSTSIDPRTGEWIIENYGVDPDIAVDNDPIKENKGIDQQLDRAIEEILRELQNRKPLPPVPAPRDWSK